MNKLKEVPEEVIERAREVLKNARSIEQMRHAQAVILPAVHGFSAEQTAEALGVNRDSVRFQAAFRQCDDISQLRERRGGRRNELMSFEQEKEFLSHWLPRAREGSMVVVSPLWEAASCRAICSACAAGALTTPSPWRSGTICRSRGYWRRRCGCMLLRFLPCN